MKYFILILATLASFKAQAGLPPTTTKLQSETNKTTTFNFDFPLLTGTRSGVTTTFGSEIKGTGVINGGLLSINANPALFDMAQVTVQFFNYSVTPLTPTGKQVTCGPFTAQTVTNLAGADSSYILLDDTCAIIQTTSQPTATQRRQYAFVGRLGHPNRTSITAVREIPDFLLSPVNQMYDFFDALGAFNVSGNKISANGANLSLNKSQGYLFRRSANYQNSNLDPHVVNLASQTPISFRYATQTTVSASNVTVLDPSQYDNAGTITAIGGGTNESSIQRVYLFSTGAVIIQYGETTYGSLATALSNLANESFIVNPTVQEGGVLIGYVVCVKGATNLQDTSQCRIIQAGRFDSGSGATASATTTLQGAYLNSVQPQITLNATQSGVQIRDAATPIASTLFAIQDTSGATNYLGVDVNGISATNFVGTGTTGAVRVHNLDTTQRNALTAANGMIIYNTTTTQFEVYDGSWLGIDYSPLTTKGDIYVYGTGNTRLGVGTNGQVLSADSAETTGLKWNSISSLTTTPTVQIFTSGSGTYTTPAGVKYIRVKMVGGGGGGGGSGTTTTGGTGGTGGNSTFGTSLLTANGGTGGASFANAGGGTGGLFTVNSPAVNFTSTGGSDGNPGFSDSSNGSGGGGGSSCFGGAGRGASGNNAGLGSRANSGSGGGGAGGTTAGVSTGGGGGAGGCVDAVINSPSSTYSYAVGAAGTAGTAGTSGFAGGAGAAGKIIVEEYYQ